MKKKLLAMILSVVMLVALLVPAFAINAEDAVAKVGLGAVEIQELKGVKYVTFPVVIAENSAEMVAIRYLVISDDGLTPYNFRAGDEFAGTWEDDFGDVYDIEFGATVNKNFADRLQVLHSASKDFAGVICEGGVLGTAYFVAPTEIGSYTFRIEVIDASCNVRDASGMPSASAAKIGYTTQEIEYTVECENHVEGEPEVTKEAKCGVAGEEVVKCTVCGKVLKTNEIKALEHAWDNGTAAEGVACGSTADVTYKCTREGCGETKVETGAKVEHDWVEDEDAYVAPKCGVAGKKVYKCTNENCPVKTKEEAVKALEHAWDNGTADASKVCGETADITYKCTREDCGETKVETGAKIEHDWVEDEDAYVAPKCGVAGKKVYVCQRANCPVATKEEPVAALEHVWGEYELTKAPTADEEGEKTATCQNEGCDEVDVIKIAKLDKEIEYKADGKVIASFKSEEAVLPEDITIDSKGGEKDEETGKITETLTFVSDLVDLEGEVEFTINTTLAGKFDNFEVYVKDAATGELTAVDFKFEKGMLTFNADLDGEYVLTYKEVKTSPSTGDASNVVVFAVIALISVAALVVVGKKRFAL
ncbi:MAG: hypothetical protein E7565_02170 [Ruminococcaceae bacterium]|nr:hypothetical protein [Oscillospiraceae bacterium]